MIFVICGLIGAGKSSYANEHYENVTECEVGTKEQQIAATLRFYRSGADVAHVTTYPSAEELVMAADVPPADVEWILIDTAPGQCRKNIIERNRPRDMSDLGFVIEKNRNLWKRFAESQLPFRHVTIFKTSERW